MVAFDASHTSPRSRDDEFITLALERGLMGPADVEKIQIAGQTLHESLPIVAVRLGLVSERNVAMVLGEIHNLEFIDLSEVDMAPSDSWGVTDSFLRSNRIIPLDEQENRIVVALADPGPGFLASALKLASGREVVLRIAPIGQVESIAERIGVNESSSSTSDAAFNGIDSDFKSHLKDLASEAPVIKRVSELFAGIVERGASDLHLESVSAGMSIRYRVDGEISHCGHIEKDHAIAVVSRIKLLASLDIAERRLPQDGRIQLRIKGHELDLRVSIIPTVYGESVVVRGLDKSRMKARLDAIGFDSQRINEFRTLLKSPHGILLVVGPTGSGKTTTLYAALGEFDPSKSKIITIEDPVEYQIDGINQIQVHTAIDLSFSRALRSILRQDPDIVLLGEMRDTETAQIAAQAALTGHLVLSTLHTNTAAAAITRLRDLGLPHYLIASSLIGVLSQRLIRLLCSECKEPLSTVELNLMRSHVSESVTEEGRYFKAKGCKLCGFSGFKGRAAISELIVVDDYIRSILPLDIDSSQMEEKFKQRGFKSISHDGLKRVAQGLTTFEEVLRVSKI